MNSTYKGFKKLALSNDEMVAVIVDSTTKEKDKSKEIETAAIPVNEKELEDKSKAVENTIPVNEKELEENTKKLDLLECCYVPL